MSANIEIAIEVEVAIANEARTTRTRTAAVVITDRYHHQNPQRPPQAVVDHDHHVRQSVAKKQRLVAIDLPHRVRQAVVLHRVDSPRPDSL